MSVVWIIIWFLTSVVAYFLTEAACLCCSRGAWDKSTKEFAAVCSILLGPVFLLISIELLLLALIGTGLTKEHHRIYKD